ncbi:MAG: bifunctional metallophosphatase/5'-nucleotidase [Melioribacteraceae bacterium]|nr:bifunctional metallophosphatase/5'-nucleotidase [Melioribacteraceae bacterium]
MMPKFFLHYFTRLMKLTIFLSFTFLYVSCTDKPIVPVQPESDKNIIILYTNDEHGWMEGSEGYGTAAELMGIWRETEGYSEDKDNYLILSGGDMWTGPAISTWFDGRSMVEVMNAMNYTAAAIGNHEFDFKIEGLKQRMAESSFPFLSANIREKSSGQIPEYIKPYIIKEVAGIKIGIIGLTTISTSFTTFPEYVKDYNFIDYAEALEEIVPQVKSDGAEILISIGHICSSDMTSLVPTASKLGISVIGGGHCNQLVASKSSDVALIQGGTRLENYAKLEIIYNSETKTVTELLPSIHDNIGGSPDAAVEAIVKYWRTQTDNALSEVIGYASTTIERYSREMWNMVIDSWFYTFPYADATMTNAGGIRQSIPAGDITLSTIVGLLPFNNSILQLELNGEELIDCINYDIIIGGITTVGGYNFADGTPIELQTNYSVFTIDYVYSIPEYKFSSYDTDPYTTSVHYRQPLIDWIKSLNTSSSDPLNNYLDSTPR